MPPRKGPKDSKIFKQTSLLDSRTPASPVKQCSLQSPSKNNHATKSSASKRKRILSNSSSDEISAIKLAPAANTKPISIHSSSEDENLPQISKSRKRRKLRVSSTSASETEAQLPVKISTPSETRDSNPSDDMEDIPPRKTGRLRRRKLSEPQPLSDEDMAQLANEVDEERILDSRLRTRNKNKSAFRRNLEKLKRRKLKLGDEEEEEEEGDDDDDDDDDDDEISSKPFKGSKPSGQHIGDSDGAQSSTSSDFIVEDEATTSVQLPAEFSMETHQDLSHQFKKIFQFFVHVAVQPPKKRARFMEARIQDEQYFSVPLQITRRKLSGLRDSLVSSSVWRPEFKKSLEKYPEFELVALDFAVPSCDACHLGGRMSTLLGRLSGSQYNRSGFEAVRQLVHEKPPRRSEEREEKEFHLGRFCARRTRVFHEFSHWEQSLFHTILREIDALRNAKSSKGYHPIAFFGGKNPPENLQDADGLCDWLDERRIVDMEWQKMKKMMESARHLELGDKKGETDD